MTFARTSVTSLDGYGVAVIETLIVRGAPGMMLWLLNAVAKYRRLSRFSTFTWARTYDDKTTNAAPSRRVKRGSRTALSMF